MIKINDLDVLCVVGIDFVVVVVDFVNVMFD